MPSFYPEGNTAQWTDDPQRSLVKIVDLLAGGGGGGGAGTGTYFGVGSPEGVVTAAPGSTYSTALGEFWSKVTGTGNTGWIQLLGQ